MYYIVVFKVNLLIINNKNFMESVLIKKTKRNSNKMRVFFLYEQTK